MPHVFTVFRACSNLQITILYFFSSDSFDTRRAMAVLKDFIGLVDQYSLRQTGTDLSFSEACAQIHAATCFVLRLLRVFGVADETIASMGTPVPVGATVAGEVICDTDKRNSVCLPEESSSTDQLHRSWLSMDAPTLSRFRFALEGALKAAHTFSRTLLAEGKFLFFWDCFIRFRWTL